MLLQMKSFIRENILPEPGLPVLLAISGGVDSIVMADLFHKAGIPFALAHANFQLRGGESERDEQFVLKLAEKYRVEIFVKRFDTARYARSKKISIQVAARELRYRWFDELLDMYGFEYVATAHHLDDQVETFLINLARGTGIAGLHGIPVKQGRIIRPMMFAGRAEIQTYAAENHLEFVDDSSNQSMKYTRNRIRHKIIPQLEKLNPSFRNTLSETIGKIRVSEAIYQNAVEEKRKAIVEINGDTASIRVSEFFNLDPLQAYAYELLAPYGFNQANINDIISLKDSIPGKEVRSTTHRLVRDRDILFIVPKYDQLQKQEYEINWSDLREGIFTPVQLSFEILEKIPVNLKSPGNTALFDLEKLSFPLHLRKWRRGDYFVPFGMANPKKLSDFFIDLKFSKLDKENQWLLCSGNDIAWIIGKRIDDRFKVIDQTSRILKIRVNPS